jgi:hypothetical protein
MTDPAQQPPTRREHAAVRVVGHHLRVVADAPAAQGFDQRRAARQVAAEELAVGTHLRARQIRIDIGKLRAFDMADGEAVAPALGFIKSWRQSRMTHFGSFRCWDRVAASIRVVCMVVLKLRWQ